METKQKIIKIAKYLKLICIGYIIFSIIYFGYYYFFNPYDLILKDNSITIEVNSEYKEQGYRIISFKEKKEHIIISNNVNTNKLGTYEVIYKMGKITKKRIVNVVDTTPPEITILKNDPTYYCPNKKPIDYGVKISDNYDKNLTKKVKTTIKKDKIIYEITDQSGNKTIKERKLIEKDIIPPTINIEKTKTVYQGTKYTNKYTAKDNCDGNITKKVIITGNVDINKLGTYQKTYTVKDSKGNTTTIKQTIKVKPLDLNNKIYLTFDDGPSTNVTPQILNILKENNIKATFFVINHGSSTDYLIKKEFDEGHTIGLHSYSHNYSKIYKSKTSYYKDLSKIENKVFNITKTKSKIIRFPGGSSNTISIDYKKGIMSTLTKEAQEKGYIYQDWNVGSNDTSTNNYKTICNNVKRQLGKGTNIVLMHDSGDKTYNPKALKCIIKYGLENGYTFDKITEDTYEIHHNINN